MRPGGPLTQVDTIAEVATPERVRFRCRVAGPGPRAAALVIDLLLQLIGLSAAGGLLFVAGWVGGTAGAKLAFGLLLLLGFFVTSSAYGALFEWAWAGRTPGKAALGLRVVHDDGSPVDLRDAVLRNLLRSVDALPGIYVVGALVMAFDPRMRRAGDLVAGTMVVHDAPSALLGLLRPDPPVSDAERAALPARVELAPPEVRAIELILRRRDALPADRLDALAQPLVDRVADRIGRVADSPVRTLELAWARATGADR